MKRIVQYSLLLLTLLGCAKWVNVDISNESIEILSPSDKIKDSIQVKTFWWNKLEGATQYYLQVVSPNFDSIEAKIYDKIDSTNSVELSLLPGVYEWRVKGINDDFETPWSTYSIEVTSSNYLTGQSITGVTPMDSYNSNEMKVNFSWDNLYATDNYILKIVDQNNNVIELYSNATTNHDFTFKDEGLYTIKLQAINALSASLEKEFEIRIDTTSPSINQLITPVFDTISTFPVTFEWQTTVNNGGAIQEQLIIGTDSLLNNVIMDSTFSESTTIQLDTITTQGKLFWKINRVDEAGNSTQPTDSKPFWVK